MELPFSNNKAKSLVPFYVADRTRQIPGEATRKTENQQAAEQSKLDVVDNELANRRDELEQVKISIAQDNIGQMKREIDVLKCTLIYG